MRTTFAVALMLLALAEVANAQNYPWCAQYTSRGGPRNCGFVSWEQCMATVRGVGGYCERNAMYQPGLTGDNRPRKRQAY
jgi:uncharacterized protein DUF3551